VNGLSTPCEAALLDRWRARDPDAFAILMDRYELPVFRYLLAVLRDRHAAEDTLQETFAIALLKLDGARPESLRGWFFAVAHQQAMLWKRRAKRVPATTDGELWSLLLGREADPADSLARRDDAAAIRELMAKLPVAQQQVLSMRLFDGLKFRDVAERLGCPLNTALARMRDGLQNLRTLWEERHAG